MNMKRRIRAFGLVAVVLIAALLAGCGGGEETSTTTTTTSQSSSTTYTQTQTQTTNTLADLLAMAASHQSVYYETIMTSPGQPTFTSKYWIKGTNKVRVENIETGIITFMYLEEEATYIYFPPPLRAIYKLKLDPASAPADPTSIMENSPIIIGEETIDGKDCIIVQYTFNGAATKAWIWKDIGFPIKIETMMNGVSATIISQNFSFADIPDSMFELPEGVTIVDLGDATTLPTTFP
jgi:hypothetical protein